MVVCLKLLLGVYVLLLCGLCVQSSGFGRLLFPACARWSWQRAALCCVAGSRWAGSGKQLRVGWNAVSQ